jgi:hypothetical protein
MMIGVGGLVSHSGGSVDLGTAVSSEPAWLQPAKNRIKKIEYNRFI